MSVYWSEVTETTSEEWGDYRVRHKYRMKNYFGAYVEKDQMFYLTGNGAVVMVEDL